MRQLLVALCTGIALLSTAAADIQSREIEYRGDGISMRGYLAWNEGAEGPRPGVLVVHEWWGHNDYARERARMLAAQGYVALAVDMYGDGRSTEHPAEANAFMQAATERSEGMSARFNAALRTLQAQAETDAGRIAAIGYCFGGGVVLNMARAGAPLAGVASFHGSLAPMAHTAEADTLRSSIIVFNGAADPMVSAESIAAFKAEMDAADADYEFIDYPGVLHSFTNPDADRYAEHGLPVAYDAAADADSWERLQLFLARIFR